MAVSETTIDELTRELAQKAAEARVLQQVSAEINATLELEEILDIVLRTMAELFGFKHALVLLVDEDGEHLSVAASRGYDGRGVGAKVKVGVGVIGVVAKKHRVMRVNNLGAQRAYAAAVRKQVVAAGRSEDLGGMVELPGLPDAERQIAIPMLIKDRLIGVFSVESASQGVFNDRDEVLATIVANQAASAIHNAQLYRSEERRREELAEAHERLKRLAETLEDRVRERTAELEQTLHELRSTQTQLVQTSKMASLGKLVAGVAHELNTPIGSISSNAQVAMNALEIVRAGLGEKVTERRLRGAIVALNEACEAELLAADRVASIVKSLRNFVRLDEAERKLADVNEGIRTTLVVLRHELKLVEVDLDLAEVPRLLCYPNQLNQVFMNLLVNARHAIEPPGKITIRSRAENGEVILSFQDTGTGIAPEHLQQIFDPGFTTKGVGVGTGLGLAICYQIVQRHGGQIEVDSEPGKGSVFTVRLPAGRF
jgi:signal transduction histidine kinase